MKTFKTVIVAGEAGKDLHSAEVLDANLTLLTQRSWQIQYVLPNGVNRWTVIASKDSE